MMRAIELFAGAGGAALGLEAAGIEHAALCEWDSHACATLRAAGLGPVVEGDVRDLDAIAAVAGESCDLLWSSFPCQAWSVAGSRKGAQDDRNGWPWTVDAIDRFGPRWFLGENVRGLTFHSRSQCGDPLKCAGCYFERVILRDLRERFAFVGYWILDAADYGVPQHRRRVILWAGPVPLQQPKPTHRDPKAHADLFDQRLPWVSMGEALGLTGTPIKAKGTAYLAGNYRGRDGGAKMETHSIDEPSRALPLNNVPYLLARPSPTVLATESKGRTSLNSKTGRVMRASDALALSTGRRRLTVAECALLQDFPADHPWQGTKKAQYRQVGNAVPPTLARVVGEVVARADTQTTTQPVERGL